MALEVGLMNILIGLGLEPGAGEKVGDDLAKGVLPAGEKLGKDLGDRISKGLSKTGKTLTKAVTAPLLAGGAAIIGAGLQLDEALDSIRIGTGATGAELDALEQSFKNVANNVAAPYESIAPVIADLNTRLGLTGKPLETLGKQLLDLQQITGEAADTESVARLFAAFRIPAEQQSAALDSIFRASQATGIAFNDLASQAVGNAAQFQELGFSLEESVAFLGQLEKSGADSGAVLAGLRKTIAASIKGTGDAGKVEEKRAKSLKTVENATLDLQVAEQKLAELRANPKAAQSALLAAENQVTKLKGVIGEETAAVEGFNKALAESTNIAAASTEEFFKSSQAEIKRLLDVGDEAAAKELAASIFGTKGLANILDGIRSGTFDVENFAASISGAGDTISGLADETGDFPEQFQKFKNQLTTDLGEIGTEVFPVVSEAIRDFLPVLKDIIIEFAALSKEFVPIVKDVLAQALPIIRELAQRFQDLSPETKKIVATLIGFAGVLGPILGPVSKLVPLIGGLAKVFNLLRIALVANPWLLAIVAIAGAAFLIYKNFDTIKEFVSNVFEAIGRVGAAVFDALVGAAAAAVEFVIGVFQTLGGALAAVWDGITAAAGAVWDFIKAGAQLVVDVIVGYFRTLFSIYSAIWDAIRAVAQGVWEGLVAIAQFVVSAIVGYFTGLLTIYQTIWNGIKEAGKVAFEAVVAVARSVVDRLRSIFGGVRNFFTGIWNGVRDSARNAVDTVLRLFSNLRDRILSIFKSILSLPKQLLSNIPGIGGIFRAEGGPVEGGRPYIVGEQGPELVVPRASGVVVSNQQLAGALGGMGGRSGGDNYEIVITNPEPEPASTSIPAALRRASYLRSR